MTHVFSKSIVLSKSVLMALFFVASPALAQDGKAAKSKEDSKVATQKPAIDAVGEIKLRSVGGLGMRRNIWKKVVVDKPNDLLRLRTTNPNAAAKKAFRQRVASYEDKLVACVKGELVGRSKNGFLSIEVIAETDGTVSKSTVVKNELGEEVEACISKLLAPINYGQSSAREKFVVFVQWKPNFQPAKNTFNGLGFSGTGAGGTGSRLSKENAKRQNDTVRGAVVPDDWSVEGGLETQIARRVIRRHRRSIQYCYEKQLQVEPKLEGKVTVEMTVQQSGRVDTAKLVDSSLDDAKLEDCLTRVHKRLRFPRPESGQAKITFDLNFSPL